MDWLDGLNVRIGLMHGLDLIVCDIWNGPKGGRMDG